MQFGENRQRRHRTVKLDPGRSSEAYPHTLQFYNIPPTENISLQEFEEFAVDRLKVLKAVETVGIKHVRGTKKYQEALADELQQLKKQGILKGLTKKFELEKDLDNEDYEDRRKDHISHFILRLAYCRSEELRRWFIQQELDLFRFRFNQETEGIQKFLELNNLKYTPIPVEEKNSILKELIDASSSTGFKTDNADYFKVPFTEVLDLVRLRRVFLWKGSAYVPQSELVVIILTHFRANLSHSLAVTSRALPQLEEDDRLLPMLSGLSKRYLGQDYTNKKHTAGQITADMIDTLSKKAFPMCMSTIHQSLRQHHHLKHWGRQQYGLFLKGIGLSLEEAMKFWRTEFTKLVDSDKFDKQYAYNIRHNYGKEGKRADYTPYSCVRIITSNAPGPGDYHGCPFRHMDADLLKQKLQSMGVRSAPLEQIMTQVRAGHVQLACGRYFGQLQLEDIGDAFTPNHPNQYFDEYQKYQNPTKPPTDSQKSSTPVAVRIVPVKNTPSNTSKAVDEFEDFPMSAADMELAMQGVEDA